jgi:hypothetical protein
MSRRYRPNLAAPRQTSDESSHVVAAAAADAATDGVVKNDNGQYQDAELKCIAMARVAETRWPTADDATRRGMLFGVFVCLSPSCSLSFMQRNRGNFLALFSFPSVFHFFQAISLFNIFVRYSTIQRY